ncbi:uncharacterized protein PITG_09733 [Phytophthora infestans T30-4]|uniref:Uncharacterized protein n=1 Tax=Phytophthora infestans (strain T30-4) TaxID=403677 RepID=D0NCP2_PHYIT|nr:uncharacterized protein PITG_09733 [Phytophthora infestans T30-4]EEY55756.1 hypothetical protein PITG_09733 [Phytophthora infestans T30-4]|eukprot:XP_002903332.1 hypothetical protein PITG_09733 [Phytophthora infestans T30-4]
MGKLAAYAVAGRQVPCPDDSKPTTLISVGLGQEPASPLVTAPVSQSLTALPSTCSISRELEDAVAEVDRAVDPDDILESTEQALGPCITISKSTYHTGVERLASLNDEETSSVHGEAVETVSIDVFDSGQFMNGLRAKNLFDSIPDDDVNLVVAADLSDSESDADDDNVMEDNQCPPGDDGRFSARHVLLLPSKTAVEDGAVPRGTFSRFMKRDRFEAIMQFPHFNNNEGSGAHEDKAWKI